MTELTFARAFLTALDSRPIKISADHVEDPRSFPQPASRKSPKPPCPSRRIILPVSPNPCPNPPPTTPHPPPPPAPNAPSPSPSNPSATPIDLALPDLPLSTSVLDLKHALEAQAGVPADKARILHRKKPVPDSKILKDLVDAADDDADADTTLELAVMAPAPVPGPDGTNAGAAAVVASPQFWEDLRGFLIQRVKDEKTGEELATLFKKSWETKGK
ncbi:unnamed protein product [Parascedosporium putredinis]|uniref:Ubiquitin-like domain-containing protein n=1 Tax=Parascedosporium putredinis TaxID=1442378 RepID=A0A9P1GXD5_9PEZI|nr:unnamed protein product [Parascedosporium putredinis]CAI7990494.1 unnamed protein product [Parascedosporium putredinis]